MIQANELRIGNWVKIGQFYTTICFINGDEDYFEPIPLTPEILGKVGFVYDKAMDSYDRFFGDSGMISICPFDFSFLVGHGHVEMGFAGGVKSVVKSVHRLQNLYFALTGEELQINL